MKSMWWVIVGAALTINGPVAAQEADLFRATSEARKLVAQETTAARNAQPRLSGSRIVVFNRACSGVANSACIANCDTGQWLLSATAFVTKNGLTASESMAPTSNKGIAFITPNLAYDQFRIRLVCLVTP
jgi:hypothetical protein